MFGLFFVAPKDIFADAGSITKIKSLIVNLRSNIKANATLLGDTDRFDDSEKLVLWYSSSNNSCCCKTMSADGGKGAQQRGVDWKFTQNAMQWVMIETFYEFDETFQLANSVGSIDDAIQNPLEALRMQIKESQIFYNGIPINRSATIDSLVDGKKLKKVKADIFRRVVNGDGVISSSLIGSIVKFRGTVCSRVWSAPKATASEVDEFIKNDICRTLGIRLQILTDSLVDNVLVQNEVLINEPPRRVYFPISIDNVQFCEYIFPNEMPKTVVMQIKEVLDVDVRSDQIQSSLELVAETITPVETKKEVVTSHLKPNDSSKIYVIGIFAALIILALSILVHFMIK